LINPAGTECPHYYEDFHRGRNVMECRLVRIEPDSLSWRPRDCVKCPVPVILRANGNPDMALGLTISRGLLGIGRRKSVRAWCRCHEVIVEEPPVGCPQCNAERPGIGILLGGSK
jgi:hypothetical protein